MLVCVFVVHFCTRDRGCSVHPVFPAPSFLEGQGSCKTPGASRRGTAKACLGSLKTAPDAVGALSYPPLEGEGRLASREARCETGWGDGPSTRGPFEGRGRDPPHPR